MSIAQFSRDNSSAEFPSLKKSKIQKLSKLYVKIKRIAFLNIKKEVRFHQPDDKCVCSEYSFSLSTHITLSTSNSLTDGWTVKLSFDVFCSRPNSFHNYPYTIPSQILL